MQHFDILIISIEQQRYFSKKNQRMANYDTKIILLYINGIIHRISSNYLQEQIIQYGIISFMHKPVCNLVLIFKDNAVYDSLHRTIIVNPYVCTA